MTIDTTRQATGKTTPSIHQWQWEQALGRMRRRVAEATVGRHWSTTGVTDVDARARALIAEWKQLDADESPTWEPNYVVDAMIYRALRRRPRELYVVEECDDETVAARRLRDQVGICVDWLEGRTGLAAGDIVAMRVVELEPWDRLAATLPMTFGDEPGVDRLLAALLRGYGGSEALDWRDFMRGEGARIVLEYGLAKLERTCCSETADETVELQRPLTEAFRRLEEVVDRRVDTARRRCRLADGRIAWLEDVCAGPHLMIFDSITDYRRYRRGLRIAGEEDGAGSVPWCRMRRVSMEELSSLERRHVRDGDDERGVVRLRRRDRRRCFVDPSPDDVRAAREACRRLADDEQKRAA